MAKVFRQYVRNCLEAGSLPASSAAVELLLMVAAHESGGFQYVRQVEGSALGLFQMEHIGFLEVNRYMQQRPEKFTGVQYIRSAPFQLLNFDQCLATQAARIFFMRIPEPLPVASDVGAMATYAKKHWNTSAGKATPEKYVSDYRLYIDATH